MFYEQFQSLCRQKGVSESEVAKALGFSTATPWKWSLGTTPRNNTLKKLAAYFDVSPEYFFENGNDKRNQITDSQIANGNIGAVTMTKNGPAPSQQGTGSGHNKEKAPCAALRKVPFPHQKKRKRSMKNTGWNAPRAIKV